jgi:hypothetical protein
MSTFYLLPPRPLLADRFAAFLRGLLPGLDWDTARRPGLTGALEAAVLEHPDVYVVYREDLPDGQPLPQALADAFGAEPGDEVVEVHATGRPGELATRRWRMGPPDQGAWAA